jgi:hypothetical protein
MWAPSQWHLGDVFHQHGAVGGAVAPPQFGTVCAVVGGEEQRAAESLALVAEVDVAGIDALDDRDLLPVPPLVDLHADPLLFLCYLLTDA